MESEAQVGAILGARFKCCICSKQHTQLNGVQAVTKCWGKLKEAFFQKHCGWSYVRESPDNTVSLNGKIAEMFDSHVPEEGLRWPMDYKHLLAAPTREAAFSEFSKLLLEKVISLHEPIVEKIRTRKITVKTRFQSRNPKAASREVTTAGNDCTPQWKDWELILGDPVLALEAAGLMFTGMPIDIRAQSATQKGAVLFCLKCRHWGRLYRGHYGYGGDVPYSSVKYKIPDGEAGKINPHQEHLVDVLVHPTGIYRLTDQITTVKEAEALLHLTKTSPDDTIKQDGKLPGAVAGGGGALDRQEAGVRLPADGRVQLEGYQPAS